MLIDLSKQEISQLVYAMLSSIHDAEATASLLDGDEAFAESFVEQKAEIEAMKSLLEKLRAQG